MQAFNALLPQGISLVNVAAAGVIAGYAALWSQLLPNSINKLAFNTATVTSIIVASGICRLLAILKALHVLPRRFSENLARAVTSLVLKVGSLFCPHVKVEVVKGSLRWEDIPSSSAFALNHTSFMDTILYLWLAPRRFIWGSKTLYKSSLAKLWFFGQITTACGMFPVYFKNDTSAEFTVEKDRQAKVSEEVNQYLLEGGGLSFFPEGVVNKTPEKLCDFRHGSFASVIQHKLPIYYMVTWGNHTVWPAAGLGGNAATIRIKYGRLDVDFSESDLTPKVLAERLQAKMQEEVDRLREMKE